MAMRVARSCASERERGRRSGGEEEGRGGGKGRCRCCSAPPSATQAPTNFPVSLWILVIRRQPSRHARTCACPGSRPWSGLVIRRLRVSPSLDRLCCSRRLSRWKGKRGRGQSGSPFPCSLSLSLSRSLLKLSPSRACGLSDPSYARRGNAHVAGSGRKGVRLSGPVRSLHSPRPLLSSTQPWPLMQCLGLALLLARTAILPWRFPAERVPCVQALPGYSDPRYQYLGSRRARPDSQPGTKKKDGQARDWPGPTCCSIPPLRVPKQMACGMAAWPPSPSPACVLVARRCLPRDVHVPRHRGRSRANSNIHNVRGLLRGS